MDARNIAELPHSVRDLGLRTLDVACIAQVADESRVLLDRSLLVARKRERRGETAVRGEVSGVEGDRLAQQTDRRGPIARPAERGCPVPKHAQGTRAVLLLEVHLREAAVSALGRRKLVDQVLEALLGLPQPALLKAVETFFESDLVVEVSPGHARSLRSARSFGLSLGELRSLSGPFETGFLPLLGAGVSGDQAGLTKWRGVLLVRLDESARDPVRDRTDLARHAAALDLHHGVEPARRVRHRERQERLFGRAVTREVVVEGLPVDHNGALAGHKPDAGA